MEKYSIPHEQAAGIMTAAKLEDTVIVRKEIEDFHMMAIVTAGRGTNIMVFMDAHFTDGALVDGYMAATEAKVKALQKYNLVDSHSSTDTLLLALTQQGKKITNAGSGSIVGKEIGQMVYGAIKEMLSKHNERVH